MLRYKHMPPRGGGRGKIIVVDHGDEKRIAEHRVGKKRGLPHFGYTGMGQPFKIAPRRAEKKAFGEKVARVTIITRTTWKPTIHYARVNTYQ